MKSNSTQAHFLSETLELQIPKVRWNSNVIIFLQWLLSTGVSLVFLLAYQKYANDNGISLEKGCDGPGLSFGMLSGVLFFLQLKYSIGTRKSK